MALPESGGGLQLPSPTGSYAYEDSPLDGKPVDLDSKGRLINIGAALINILLFCGS